MFNLLPIKKLGYFLITKFWELYIFWIQILYHKYDLQIFLSGVSFSFYEQFLSKSRSFPFLSLSICYFTNLVWSKKSLPNPKLQTVFSPCVPFLSSVQLLSRVWLLATPWTTACQASLSITNSWSLPNSSPLSWWCHPTISSSVVPFSCPQSFPASGSFQMSQLFASGGQSTGVSASTSVLPVNTQDWSPLGWTGWISLQFKGLSRIFANTIVQQYQVFGAQLYL